MIPSLRNLSYKERLKNLGMFSLRCRRLRGDMIEVFKMIQGIDKINLEKLFYVDEDKKTRKYCVCLKIRRDVNSIIGTNIFCYSLLLLPFLEKPPTPLSPYSYSPALHIWYSLLFLILVLLTQPSGYINNDDYDWACVRLVVVIL